MKITAIIPIKHQSTRVPGKNYREMNGRPLFHYILETISNSKHITDIVVDTNSPTIKEGIINHFPHIQIYDRPKELWSNDTSTNTLLMNVIKSLNLNSDLYFQTHATNPLLTIETIDRAIEMFVGSEEGEYDSLFSVKTHHTRFYNKDGEDMNHDRHFLIPTQDLDPIYEENSCMYLFTYNSLLKWKSRIGIKPMLYKMNDIESQDIDWEDDFKITELMMRYQLSKKDENNLDVSKGINQKVIVVTGCEGGIGSGVCRYFSEKGWYVIGTDILRVEDRTKDNLRFVSKYIECDLTNNIQVLNLVRIIQNTKQHIDCLVNNAAYQTVGSLQNLKLEEWDRVMDCNLKAPMIISTKLLDNLTQTKGSIINISSVHSTTTSPDIGAYACSKAALAGLTRNMAIEFGKKGVRVNSISPGAIDTRMLRQGLKRECLNPKINSDDLVKKMANKHLLGRVGNAEDIARTIEYMIDCEFIMGQNVVVDGGVSIQLKSE